MIAAVSNLHAVNYTTNAGDLLHALQRHLTEVESWNAPFQPDNILVDGDLKAPMVRVTLPHQCPMDIVQERVLTFNLVHADLHVFKAQQFSCHCSRNVFPGMRASSWVDVAESVLFGNLRTSATT
jgi:hypothetical protein